MLSYLLAIVAYLQGAFKLKYKQKEKLKMTQRGKAVVNEKKKNMQSSLIEQNIFSHITFNMCRETLADQGM